MIICEITINQANLDNSHFYLLEVIDRFPPDAIGGSSKARRAKRDVEIDWGGPDPVLTDIDGSPKKKFFRARGWVRRFFELNDAVPGDRVIIEERGPYAYAVRLQKP
jgi:hypothetical protein